MSVMRASFILFALPLSFFFPEGWVDGCGLISMAGVRVEVGKHLIKILF